MVQYCPVSVDFVLKVAFNPLAVPGIGWFFLEPSGLLGHVGEPRVMG